MIITFYSYKGGVGRSMAVANIAQIFANAGFNTLICDFDLEAPGIEKYFYKNSDKKDENDTYKNNEIKDFINNEGIIDIIYDYKNVLSNEKKHSKDEYINNIKYKEIKKNKEESFFIKLPCNYIKSLKEYDNISILSAGKRSSQNIYSQKVNNLNWNEFYSEWAGAHFFEIFRQDLIENFDIILIDSRTGSTEYGGLCVGQLPDIVFNMTNGSNSCFEGMRKITTFIEEFSEEYHKKITVIPLASRIDQQGESNLLTKFEEKFSDFFLEVINKQNDVLSHLLIDNNKNNGAFLENLRFYQIPYKSIYSFDEKIVDEKDHSYTIFKNIYYLILDTMVHIKKRKNPERIGDIDLISNSIQNLEKIQKNVSNKNESIVNLKNSIQELDKIQKKLSNKNELIINISKSIRELKKIQKDIDANNSTRIKKNINEPHQLSNKQEIIFRQILNQFISTLNLELGKLTETKEEILYRNILEKIHKKSIVNHKKYVYEILDEINGINSIFLNLLIRLMSHIFKKLNI